MSSAFPKYKKRILAAVLSVGIAAAMVPAGCQKKTAENENRAFEEFTKEVFCREVASNTISLHYTLKNPEDYGIEETTVTFGGFETEKDAILASVENLQQAMAEYDYGNLSVENRLTYDVLDYYLERTEADAKYILYEEPLGLVSGVQTQLPVILSEYPFYDKEDVDTYLELMKTTPEYFEELTEFEQAKSKAGLFMSDEAAQEVITQCMSFMNMGESNYLISTFVERIKQVEGFSEEEKSKYIQKNALMLSSYVLPAYSKLVAKLQTLMGTGENEMGLCYLPEGKEYYKEVVKDATGSSRSVAELKGLTKQQIIADLEAMEKVLGIAGEEEIEEQDAEQGEEQAEEPSEEQDIDRVEEQAEEPSEERDIDRVEEQAEEPSEEQDIDRVEEQAIETMSMDAADPVAILNSLEEEITKAFPESPDTTVSVKYVPEAMEEHLSPAFYMIPAIDNYEDNVIYVNQAHMGNTLTLFTTLAHEGYPGHLYQTVYYASTDPDPLRSIFNFGGYVEGWATYAEMCSYSLAPLTREQSTLLQKNSSIILGLYTLADIGIHYEGWSRMDTFSFFSNYGISDIDTVNRIYDLILGSPGNYLKYYIGYLEFLELKKEWVAEKGEEFSQKEFHEAVLSVGPAPFELVEKYIR